MKNHPSIKFLKNVIDSMFDNDNLFSIYFSSHKDGCHIEQLFDKETTMKFDPDSVEKEVNKLLEDIKNSLINQIDEVRKELENKNEEKEESNG